MQILFQLMLFMNIAAFELSQHMHDTIAVLLNTRFFLERLQVIIQADMLTAGGSRAPPTAIFIGLDANACLISSAEEATGTIGMHTMGRSSHRGRRLAAALHASGLTAVNTQYAVPVDTWYKRYGSRIHRDQRDFILLGGRDVTAQACEREWDLTIPSDHDLPASQVRVGDEALGSGSSDVLPGCLACCRPCRF